MATTHICTEGSNVGVWCNSNDTDSSVTIQANKTSASLMLYPNGRSTGKELPFVIGVSHDRDKGERHGFIQVPTMTGERKTRYFTFAELIAALDAAPKVEALAERVAALESLLSSRETN